MKMMDEAKDQSQTFWQRSRRAKRQRICSLARLEASALKQLGSSAMKQPDVLLCPCFCIDLQGSAAGRIYFVFEQAGQLYALWPYASHVKRVGGRNSGKANQKARQIDELVFKLGLKLQRKNPKHLFVLPEPLLSLEQREGLLLWQKALQKKQLGPLDSEGLLYAFYFEGKAELLWSQYARGVKKKLRTQAKRLRDVLRRDEKDLTDRCLEWFEARAKEAHCGDESKAATGLF